VFALGATLYAAVEGIPPFGLDDNAYALLHKVATEQVRRPKQEGPVIDVIMRLLSREPEDRPSAAQAREALAAAGTGRETGFAPLASTAPPPPMSAAVDVPPAPRAQPPTLSDLKRPAPERRRRNGRVPLLLGVLAVLALGAGITAAILTGDTGGQTPTAQPATTSAPAAAASAPTTTPTPSPTQPPATTTPATTTPTAAPSDPVAFVLSYYALLPGNTDAAWALLGSEAQRESGAGGKGSYDSFWADMRSVSLLDVRQTGENTVEGTVVFNRQDGSTSSEPYRFVVGTGSDGQMIIQSFSRL
jgi:serine/threonine protein kinase